MAKKTGNKAFVDRLHDALTSCGVDWKSPTEVGQYVGLNKQTVSRWLIEGGEPSPEMLYKIADKMNVSARWLATGNGKMIKTTPIEDDEREVIEQIYRQLQPKPRAKWIRDGHELVELTAPTSAANPFSKAEP